MGPPFPQWEASTIRTPAIFLATLVAIALAAPALAAECTPTSTTAEVDTGDTPFGRYYYSEDCGITKHPCLVMFSVWIYQESNGIDGLQRGDEVRDDTCGGAIPPDIVVF